MPRVGFELLAVFDWITLLSKVKESLTRDPTGLRSWTFFIARTEAIHGGWSQRDVKALLEERGVDVYGDMFAFDELCIQVPKQQAAFAERLMVDAGIAVKARSQGAPRRGRGV